MKETAAPLLRPRSGGWSGREITCLRFGAATKEASSSKDATVAFLSRNSLN